VTEPTTDVPDAEPHDEALDLLDAALDDLDQQAPRYVDQATDVELLRLLLAVRERRKKCADIEAYLESQVVRIFPYGDHEAGKLRFRVHGGKRTKWTDPRTLAWRVTEPAMYDDNGEARADEHVVAEVLDRLLAAMSVAYFRTTWLRAAGIDYDDVCEVERTRRTIQFLGGES
jgi:hypothetical protein